MSRIDVGGGSRGAVVHSADRLDTGYSVMLQ